MDEQHAILGLGLLVGLGALAVYRHEAGWTVPRVMWGLWTLASLIGLAA